MGGSPSQIAGHCTNVRCYLCSSSSFDGVADRPTAKSSVSVGILEWNGMKKEKGGKIKQDFEEGSQFSSQNQDDWVLLLKSSQD